MCVCVWEEGKGYPEQGWVPLSHGSVQVGHRSGYPFHQLKLKILFGELTKREGYVMKSELGNHYHLTLEAVKRK